MSNCFHVNFHATVSLFRHENNRGLFASLFFLLWPPYVFISDSSPSKSNLSRFSLLLGHLSRTSFWICLSQGGARRHGPVSVTQFISSVFWKLLLSFVLYCHSIQVFPAGDLPLNLQASLSLSLVSSLPFIFSFLRSDHEDLKGQIPGSLAMCWVLRSLIHNWIVMNWKIPYRSEQLWIPPLHPESTGFLLGPLIPPPQLPLRFLLDPAQRGMAPRGPFTCLLSHSVCDWLPPPAKCDLSSYLSAWQRGPPLFLVRCGRSKTVQSSLQIEKGWES